MNATIDKQYEILAKNHMDQYFNILKKRKQGMLEDPEDFIGHLSEEVPKDQMTEYLVMEFFSRMLNSFRDFKYYCAVNYDQDCTILDYDDDLLLAKAFYKKWI